MSNGILVSYPIRFSGKIGDKTVDMNGVDLFEDVDEKLFKFSYFLNTKLLKTSIKTIFKLSFFI